MNPSRIFGNTPSCTQTSGTPFHAQSGAQLAHDVTSIGHTPARLSPPARGLSPVTQPQIAQPHQLQRVHRVREPQFSQQYQEAFDWLKTAWPACEGTTVERLSILLSRTDVPPIICQSLLHGMLKDIEKTCPPQLLDIKKAYIGIGVGTTSELNEWVEKTWSDTAGQPVKQRVRTLLIKSSPRTDLKNVTTLYAILWHQLGKDTPALSMLKNVSKREWPDYWIDPRIISWITRYWRNTTGKSMQAKVAMLLRQSDIPPGIGVSVLTAAFARVLGNKAPGFDSVSRAFRQVREEKQSRQPVQKPALVSAALSTPQAACCAAASHSQSSLSYIPAAAGDLTAQQYYQQLNNSNHWATTAAAQTQPTLAPYGQQALTAQQCNELLNSSHLWARVSAVLDQPTFAPDSAEETTAQQYHQLLNDSNLWARVSAVLNRPMFESEVAAYVATTRLPAAANRHD